MVTWAQKTKKPMAEHSGHSGHGGVIQAKTGQPKPMRPPYMAGALITSNRYYSRLNGAGLPEKLEKGIENLSGMSMDDVRVHYNSPLPDRFNALAYTMGRDIHLARGREQYLPHEAWHAVQQKQGRVKPTLNSGGAHINDSPGLENEADRMGTKALQLPGEKGEKSAAANANPGHTTNTGVLQLTRKYMGTIKDKGRDLEAWWDDANGKYYTREIGGIEINPRSERYYAEGPGTHAYNIAKNKEGTLVKASEYMAEGGFSREWRTKYDAVKAGMPQNMKFEPGGGKGNVLTAGKWAGSTSGRPTTRKHDLLQLTFPRGPLPMPDPGDIARVRTVQAEDAQIVLGFLQTAARRVKPNGEMKVVVMDKDFYTGYMDNIVLRSPVLAQLNIVNTERKTLRSEYHNQQLFSKETDPNLKYEHLQTQKGRVLAAGRGRHDVIYTFKLRQP